MPKRHDLRRPRANCKPSVNHSQLCRPPTRPGSAPLAYMVFCNDHWPVYWRFSSVVVGSPHRGEELARAALSKVAARWPAVLGSASPSAAAWDLLSQECASRRTDSADRMHHMLERKEADALILRHKLGLTPGRPAMPWGWRKPSSACCTVGLCTTSAPDITPRRPPGVRRCATSQGAWLV